MFFVSPGIEGEKTVHFMLVLFGSTNARGATNVTSRIEIKMQFCVSMLLCAEENLMWFCVESMTVEHHL
jgi:hypothetical protein